MNLTSIIKKISNGEWHYALGRFEAVRGGYSALRRMAHRLPSPPISSSTLFPVTFQPESFTSLRRDAIAFGFDLPSEVVQEIQLFAKTTLIVRRGDVSPFHYTDVKDGRLTDGSPIAIGTILEAENCPAVARIMADPGLRYFISSYLGYTPSAIKPWLFWSFVTPLTDAERLKMGQTVRFHFDVDGFNFTYANFYLTPVNSNSGAHIMVKGSHRNKSLRMLFHSANQTDEAVLRRFGIQNQILIEGPAGCGFVEDSSCYHKALPPVERERLMLQIRFT